MKKSQMKSVMACAALAAGLSGCFTLKETPYPQTAAISVPEGKNLSVQLRGFKALMTEYASLYGYDTVWVAGRPYGRHGWRPGYYQTVMSTTYVPQVMETDVFAMRAKTLAESSGFITMAERPDYIVETTFSGPFVGSDESSVRALWLVLSLFSADYMTQTWSAKLKIYDNSTGKLVFHRDYSQRYEVAVWGPIPFFSPAGSSKNTFNAIQSWCLTALTDKVMSEAAAFLAPRAK